MRFVFDLDGTICFDGKPISRRIELALHQLEEEGHEIVFASARPIRDMLPLINERLRRHAMIGGNGGQIFKNGKMLSCLTFREDQRRFLMDVIKKYEATCLIDGVWDYTYTGPIHHHVLNYVNKDSAYRRIPAEEHPHIVKVIIVTADRIHRMLEELRESDVSIHQYRDDSIIDISPENVDKFAALRWFGVREGEYIAFGNDTNDISLFRSAKYSILVGHHEELMKVADESVQSLDEDVARKIRFLSSLENGAGQTCRKQRRRSL